MCFMCVYLHNCIALIDHLGRVSETKISINLHLSQLCFMNSNPIFRPCAMVVPDFGMICEIMLMSEGFIDARLLARKFITLYELCRELLSKQVRLLLLKMSTFNRHIIHRVTVSVLSSQQSFLVDCSFCS